MKVFIVKISAESIIRKIQNNETFIHDAISNFKTEIAVNDPVFIYFGGDKSLITWDQGLKAFGKISRSPYDEGYDSAKPNYFKIEIEPLHVLEKAISPRESKIHNRLASYLYDIPYVGANHFRNQAIGKTESKEGIIALIRLYEEFANESLNSIWMQIPVFEQYILNVDAEISALSYEFSIELIKANIIIHHNLISRFIASLCTKPLVILTGLSGSGKTKLAQAFAQWICESDNQYKIVPVGADWTNREPLLGYPNALDNTVYVKPESGVIDLLLEAIKPENAEKPFFLILDEMNLSHVERYFADFLSVLESGKELQLHSSEDVMSGVPSRLVVPKNLFVVGTVNIDETTYMFSPKVLDRASVIEFRVSESEMTGFLKNPVKPDIDVINGLGSSMGKAFVELAKAEISDFSDTDDLNNVLVEFFKELKKTGAEFGYRTASDIFRYTLIFKKLTQGAQWVLVDIVDSAIVQKLLPKLHGSRRKLEPVLNKLSLLCLTAGQEGTLLSKPEEIDYTDREKIRFPVSLEKIMRMQKRVQMDGFTSFAEA